MIYGTGFNVFYSQAKRSSEKNEAERCNIQLAGELRQATSVTSAQQTSLTFTVDTDSDGVDETIQYTWSGTSGQPLNRVVATVTTAMVNKISSAAFTYYDANNSQLSFPVTASQVRLVSLSLTVTDQNETFNLRSQFRLSSL